MTDEKVVDLFSGRPFTAPAEPERSQQAPVSELLRKFVVMAQAHPDGALAQFSWRGDDGLQATSAHAMRIVANDLLTIYAALMQAAYNVDGDTTLLPRAMVVVMHTLRAPWMVLNEEKPNPDGIVGATSSAGSLRYFAQQLETVILEMESEAHAIEAAKEIIRNKDARAERAPDAGGGVRLPGPDGEERRDPAAPASACDPEWGKAPVS